ncbi:MAG: TusE/DsrC/DsvC family sulfur relay protein [Rhodospirillaceae bacterium]|jgi:dissimilatory sulfite reductase related protein|nr:TusE/DsrC/DsvC family sulfur relay protein [Rhodospirillaceae bacterium]MBT5244136.1 TusE/DsrC/DsvC family sulfur relay protein [Rhodospirillaceae bacterium]MBT5561661.1 TusE/DsrC/DsvC family sulfur relay protein [Rhodospirillaceae bacterium]MBT6243100.1 TusE/DsrC/DsvC family sulfur relay protein [Rhodospirillaceae bacterium]MBT7137858.1 TusE/DsrC/DsvC family sulfur relay protein [Rhodospirillaceae bacterium]
MAYEVNGKSFESDEEGYLIDIGSWNEELAGLIAKDEEIDMTSEHWEVVNFLREYYNEYQIAPAVRVLVKAVKKKLGADKGSNKYLYELFPYGPAKQACKIAGLPKPTGCV